MRKFCTFFFLFWTISSVAFAAEFSDVSNSHKNYHAVKYLSDKKIIEGYSDGTFKPDNPVNRAEALKIIFKALNVDNVGGGSSFSDVPSNSWFFSYVTTATSKGIVKGYPDGTFKPERTVSLGEMLKMLVETKGDEFKPNLEYDIYVDVKKDSWPAKYAYYAREKQLILADDYGRVGVDKPVTRGMVAEVVYRLLFMVEHDKPAFPLSTNWGFYKASSLPFRMKTDPSWKIEDLGESVVIYKTDAIYEQFDFFRIYPNSARIVVTMDKNTSKTGFADYVGGIKALFPSAQYKEFTINGYKAFEVLYPERRQVDWYIYLKDSRVIAVYTEYGNGVLSLQLPRQIKAMVGSWEFVSSGGETASGGTSGTKDDLDKILSDIFANVLKEGEGMKSLNLLSDKLIIETDSIGVGTGPVDYYYSESADYSFKYERKSDVILATKSGKTSAF